MQLLKGKSAAVTGSASGIGLGIARALAGALAVFLSSGAAAQIRGATLTVDGAWTAQ